ncbi:hypothetical protein HKCCA1058_11695 [Rhodobacterales bacterium HKCCA1058]|nr:hypothetical protein [Rhodobacterales bacterium HKCCA1058]
MLLTGKDIEKQELTFKWTANGYQAEGVSVEAALGDTQRAVLNVIRQQRRETKKVDKRMACFNAKSLKALIYKNFM